MSHLDVTIVTNNHERDLVAWHMLPANERADFDYIFDTPPAEDLDIACYPDEAYSERFFQYRGSWYDYHEFQPTSESLAADGWDAVQPQSYFDAIAVRYFDRDGRQLDGVVVAHIHW